MRGRDKTVILNSLENFVHSVHVHRIFANTDRVNKYLIIFMQNYSMNFSLSPANQSHCLVKLRPCWLVLYNHAFWLEEPMQCFGTLRQPLLGFWTTVCSWRLYSGSWRLYLAHEGYIWRMKVIFLPPLKNSINLKKRLNIWGGKKGGTKFSRNPLILTIIEDLSLDREKEFGQRKSV